MFVHSAGNTIGGRSAAEGNVIAGNRWDGVSVLSDGNRVQFNRIGTNAAGDAALGNGEFGVNNAGEHTVIADNVISGNGFAGVQLAAGNDAGPRYAAVERNSIGTNAAGTAALPNGQAGVRVQSAGNTVGPDNLISGNAATGVEISGQASQDNAVDGNKIGTDVSGTAAVPNRAGGVTVSYGASDNVIGGSKGNVISGNRDPRDGTGYGISVNSDTTGTNVVGNYVGLGADGSRPLGNAGDGIYVDAPGTTIRSNVVSANGGRGVEIAAGADDNTVRGNLIGTDWTGMLDRGNLGDGLALRGSSGNSVGGTSSDRNVISGNDGEGVLIEPYPTPSDVAEHNDLEGNLIGVAREGTAPLANAGNGVLVRAGADNNTIGGAAPGAGNVISGNGRAGIWLSGAHNTIRGNEIKGGLLGRPRRRTRPASWSTERATSSAVTRPATRTSSPAIAASGSASREPAHPTTRSRAT